MNRLWIAPFAALLLLGCSEKKPPEPPVRPVLYVVVKPDLTQHLGRFAGNIEARYESTLGFRVPGRIVRRYYDVGALVKEGDILASLDPTDQQNNVRAAQGDMDKSRAQLINAQANARRQQELFNQGVGAQAQLDTAQADLKTAQAAVQQTSAALNQAKDQLSYCNLRADHDAVITDWAVEAGQVVSVGEAVATLARPEIKEAVIDLPAPLAEALPKDVVFFVAGQLDPNVNTKAHVREIAPQADSATRTRRVRLTLDQTPPAFRLGSSISVTVSSPITQHFQVPQTALQEADGKTRVWVVDPQTFTANTREVTVWRRDANTVLLSGGISSGDTVVSAGAYSLKPGQKVRLDKESSQ
ncbi:MAG TPA: efflux transporter periplasmic adaptor subunit [Pseudomonas sp.]|uniref:efflux RND transporter periplasmic adaptor subunit n=1 Tax=Pseudomonas sp. TaxID=306 RepID=UPI000ED4D50E|nr:efflux RND transporter periplasmic adaptor subunit [Pseudomonas sp.]HCN61991.1 efflux transporter periplasmic adaptor subunit [Pseudomonas sp.]